MSNTEVYVSAEVAAVRELYADLIAVETRTVPIGEWLELQASRLLEVHRDGDRTVACQVGCWHPKLVGKSRDEIMEASFEHKDARETIAREYGYENWQAASRVSEPQDLLLQQAVDLLLVGDVTGLSALIKGQPDVVKSRSRFGHKSTLLHYVGSNGIETWRQVVPRNLAEAAKVILDAGADVNATAKIYGESATLGLLLSSAHPREAGVAEQVADVLRAHGAE